MMTQICPTPSVLSCAQRRCHLLLTLCLPHQAVQPEFFAHLTGVDDSIVHQDIAEASYALQRYHRLDIMMHADGCYRIEGSSLDTHLCLMYWLRRSLRLCPTYVYQHFAPALKDALKQPGVSRALYDDTNLQALINLCAHRLQRRFGSVDRQFLHLYLQYCLLQHQLGNIPQFTPLQRSWTHARQETPVAQDILRHWQRRTMHPPHANVQHFLTALFMLLRTPNPRRDNHRQDQRLQAAISRLMARFHLLSGFVFRDEQRLHDRLYNHLTQALNRAMFGIGIDNDLPQEIIRLYPRLIRTTCEALQPLEEEYAICFSSEETGLIAVIFGAWLMQESTRQERQVVLLTNNRPEREALLEQQLRELTLLPLTIQHVPLQDFQRDGVPKNVALVVTHDATSLPLFSPPLIHLTFPPGDHQLQRIREIIES